MSIDIEVSEVGMRDGLQSIDQIMPTEAKKRWIEALALAGVPRDRGRLICSTADIPAARGHHGCRTVCKDY